MRFVLRFCSILVRNVSPEYTRMANENTTNGLETENDYIDINYDSLDLCIEEKIELER